MTLYVVVTNEDIDEIVKTAYGDDSSCKVQDGVWLVRAHMPWSGKRIYKKLGLGADRPGVVFPSGKEINGYMTNGVINTLREWRIV